MCYYIEICCKIIYNIEYNYVIGEDLMKSKKIFKGILSLLSVLIVGIELASVCGMGSEEMPESIKKLR